jgi:hypothetical protein
MILPPDDKKEPAHEGSTPTSLPQNSETLPRGTAHTSSGQLSGHSTSVVQHEPRNAATSAVDIVATPDEPTEETRLLPPPSYSEAVAQTGKAGKSRRWRYLAIGLFVVLFACVVVGITVAQQKQRDSRHGWKRGGLDGKGECMLPQGRLASDKRGVGQAHSTIGGSTVHPFSPTPQPYPTNPILMNATYSASHA